MIHYQGHGVTLHHGDCLDVVRELPADSVDAVVTDPPYGLERFQCIAIEREASYLPLIEARITRQRDPVAHQRLVGGDELTLFDDLGGDAS